jgi:serine/threonine protein kinase
MNTPRDGAPPSVREIGPRTALDSAPRSFREVPPLSVREIAKGSVREVAPISVRPPPSRPTSPPRPTVDDDGDTIGVDGRSPPSRRGTTTACRTCGAAAGAVDEVCPSCGAVCGDLPRTHIVDGRYEVDSVLGRGGMGVVYLARELWLDRMVALKVIAPRWVENPQVVASFHREARELAKIRSQHVVHVYAFGRLEGSYFFVMEYVRGRSLREILAEHKQHGATIHVRRTLTILTQIAEGIGAVHAAGIVHRDVKPANIVIEEDSGRPALVDFGLAAPGDDPNLALAVGTPRYMAPEQAGMGVPGRAVSARTDVYALACTAFEMITGRPPFEGSDPNQLMRQHARKPPPAVSSIRKELAAFDRVLARALAKDPLERYENCSEMVHELATAGQRWATGHLTSRPPPMPIERNAPIRVLVVDHDPAFCQRAGQAAVNAFAQYRKDIRVKVAGSTSVDDAIERAEVEPPDLVLLDYDIPGTDGADALSRLRALPGGEKITVVVASKKLGPDDRWLFSALGVRDFLRKPLDFPQLVQALVPIASRVGTRVPAPPT